MANKQTFVVYKSWRQVFKSLPAEQTKELICAIFDYQVTGEIDIEDPAVIAIFNMFKETMDADSAKYEETLKKRREAGAKGGRPPKGKETNKNHLVSDVNQMQANGKQKNPVSESVSVSVYDSVNDTVSDSPNGESISVSTDVDTSSAEQTRVPYQRIVDEYHRRCCPPLPRVKIVSYQRKQKIRSLYLKYGQDTILDVFDAVERSDFLTCRDGTWSGCSFDWIVKPANFIKILEGNYENKAEPLTNNPFLQMLLDGEYDDDDSGGDDND